MVAIKVTAFGGMVPAIDKRLLPDTAAVLSQNTFLYTGALEPLPKSKLLHTLALTSAGKVYRLPENYNDASYLYSSTWLEFDDADTDVIRAPVFGDDFDRYYWASKTGVPSYNTRARIENGDLEWVLGVPAPTIAPSCIVTGGVGATATRAYVYTWVTGYGEEGPPSPPLLVTDKIDGSYAITLSAPDVDDDGDPGDDRTIEAVRIYRTITSDSGVATYFLLIEQAVSDTTYTDTDTDAVLALNEQLASTNYSPPPVDLQGFVVMPNGIVAGWRENELWMSEPYRPHAWPTQYVQTMEYPIVGLGVTNQTLVICTQGFPITASGSHPSYVTCSKLTMFEPCLSRRSILSTPDGVYYASPAGLMLVNPGSVVNISDKLATRDKWQELTDLQKLCAARLGNSYYAWGTARPGVFQEDAFDPGFITDQDYSGAYAGVVVDPTTERIAITTVTSEEAVIAVCNDPWSGEVLITKDGGVYVLDLTDNTVEPETAVWSSKVWQTTDRRNFSALRLYFEVLPGTVGTDYGNVKVYADDRLIMTRDLTVSGELMRLPSGFKAAFWQVIIETRVRILSFQMATSAKELKGA